MARIERIFEAMLEAQPLDFSVKQAPMQAQQVGSVRGGARKKREFIFLMKELVDVR